MPQETSTTNKKPKVKSDPDSRSSKPVASSSKRPISSQGFFRKRDKSPDSSDDEPPLRPLVRKKKQQEQTHTANPSSLEELQSSSPPGRSSTSKPGKIGARLPQGGGSGPSSTKKANKQSYGVFGGTINKIAAKPKPIDSTKRSGNLPPGPKSKVLPAGSKSKNNSLGKQTANGSGGMEAIKDTLRQPKPVVVEKTAAELQWERDHGPDEVLLPDFGQEAEKTKLSANRFFDEYRNRVKPELELPVLAVSTKKKDDQTEALREMMDDHEDEYAGEAITPEETEYLRDHCDPDNICPFCDNPLPITIDPKSKMSKRLIRYRIQIFEDGKESIDYLRRIDFCNAHRYQSVTIPLGIRAGYPKSIHWLDLWREMEVPWISQRIEMLVKRPSISPMFRYYFSEEEGEREPKWAEYFVGATPADHISAGYYGDVGTEVIRAHINELVDWGYLPLMDQMARYKPLAPKEFVSKVLIPEIAIMLIQNRQFPPAKSDTKSDGVSILEDDLYTKAQEIRKRSTLYGKVAYYDMDSQVPFEINAEFSQASEERKTEVELIRGKPGTKKRVRAVVNLSEEEDFAMDMDNQRAATSPPVGQVGDDSDGNSDLENMSPRGVYKSSSRRARSAESNQASIRSDSTPEPHDRKRQKYGDSRRSPADDSPSSSQTMSQGSTTPTAQDRPGRDEVGGEREQTGRDSQRASKSVNQSQDSFDDFDFQSQDLDRLDALVAAQ